MPFRITTLIFSLFFIPFYSIAQSTYAERLGFPQNTKVIILHVDDVGMSFDSNKGAIESITQGMATSCSIMMPCPWVSGIMNYMKEHPDVELDAGLHLTLNSEWRDYRWAPVADQSMVSGLIDSEGAMWRTGQDVIKFSDANEVEIEIKAQIEKALRMGFRPTHLDSHMGTIFTRADFIERYVKIGMEYQIPVMFPGGHNTFIANQISGTATDMATARLIGEKLWEAGLPVLDDLFNESYGWKPDEKTAFNDKKLQKFTTEKYIETLKALKPGITMVIMHSTKTSENFHEISDSGPTRRGDYLAMIDPKLKDYIVNNGIILTTWKELMERRQKLEKSNF